MPPIRNLRNLMPSLNETFAHPLLEWFDNHGRHDLPWQHPRHAYRVWISEIMLQQTQVKTVIPYFNRFITRFPDISTLAQSCEDDVLAHWSGLGYYSRARYLHQTAQIVCTNFAGQLPSELHLLKTLPGIGPSTAAAIASLAYNKPTPILDGNVKRVLSSYFLIAGSLKKAETHQKLWQLAEQCMPHQRAADYTQAIMDLGATCCTRKDPCCNSCPLASTCLAKQHNKVSEYPNPSPIQNRPIKEQQFLLLHNPTPLIYLEKRPSPGIWGGLWCLPSLAITENATTHLSEHYGLMTEPPSEIMTLRHSFSHFHLYIKALSFAVSATETQKNQRGHWFSENELPNVGLAKPVSTIIQSFFTQSTKNKRAHR